MTLTNPKEICERLTFLGPLYHTYFGFNWNNDEDCDIIKQDDVYDEENDTYDTICHNYCDIISKSNEAVPYSSVIIKYKEDDWFGDRKQWWNYPSTWFTSDKNKSKALPYLNTKNYITVKEPFMCVKISAKKKGSQITLDDILFATRALALDDTRTYDSFSVISSTKTTLTLEPEMDNFSS